MAVVEISNFNINTRQAFSQLLFWKRHNENAKYFLCNKFHETSATEIKINICDEDTGDENSSSE